MGWYKIFQALSLDVAAGAAIFSLAIGQYFKVQIPCNVLICLSISIWIIYTCDHLLDAKKIKGQASTFRHQFHQKYQKSLAILVFIILLTGIINMFYLPVEIIYIGLVGVVFSVVYFLLLQHTSFWTKEIYIALVYTFGIFVGPIYFSYNNLQLSQWILIPQVFLLVFSNLLLFSWFDFLNDEKDGHPSMIRRWGIKKAERILKIILVAGVCFSLTLIFLNFNYSTFIIQIILLIMDGLLIMLFKQHKLFRKNDLYRMIGDGIFFIPLTFLLYEALC